MIRINLLPVRTSRKRETALRQILLAAAGGVLIVAGCAYFYFELDSEIDRLTSDNQRVEREIAKLKEVIGQVEEFEAKKAELQKKLDVIKTLKANKTGPVHMLDEIATNIPDKCWLTSISEVNRKVELSGVAVNNEVIADFISKLEVSDYFDDVYLVATSAMETKEGLKLKEFSVTARMTTPEEKRRKNSAGRPG